MADWTSIRRINESAEPFDDDRIIVKVRLSARPPAEWAERFSAPASAPSKARGTGPAIDGEWLSSAVHQRDLEKYIAEIDLRIADANTHYETVVLPQKAADTVRVETRASQDAERIRALNERLSNLPKPKR